MRLRALCYGTLPIIRQLSLVVIFVNARDLASQVRIGRQRCLSGHSWKHLSLERLQVWDVCVCYMISIIIRILLSCTYGFTQQSWNKNAYNIVYDAHIISIISQRNIYKQYLARVHIQWTRLKQNQRFTIQFWGEWFDWESHLRNDTAGIQVLPRQFS